MPCEQRSWNLSEKGTLQLFSRSQREYAINEEGFSAETHGDDGERQFKARSSPLRSLTRIPPATSTAKLSSLRRLARMRLRSSVLSATVPAALFGVPSTYPPIAYLRLSASRS